MAAVAASRVLSFACHTTSTNQVPVKTLALLLWTMNKPQTPSTTPHLQHCCAEGHHVWVSQVGQALQLPQEVEQLGVRPNLNHLDSNLCANRHVHAQQNGTFRTTHSPTSTWPAAGKVSNYTTTTRRHKRQWHAFHGGTNFSACRVQLTAASARHTHAGNTHLCAPPLCSEGGSKGTFAQHILDFDLQGDSTTQHGTA